MRPISVMSAVYRLWAATRMRDGKVDQHGGILDHLIGFRRQRAKRGAIAPFDQFLRPVIGPGRVGGHGRRALRGNGQRGDLCESDHQASPSFPQPVCRAKPQPATKL